MMFSGSRRRMFRNETPATKKPSLTRQAIGILASSRELMDEVQPVRMANGGNVNVIETYLDQARRMATTQGLTPGSMPYNQVVGILYNKLSSTDPSVDQLFPPRAPEPIPVDVSTPLTRRAFTQQGLGSFRGINTPPVIEEDLGPIKVPQSSTSAAVPQAGIASLTDEERYGSVDINPFNPLGREPRGVEGARGTAEFEKAMSPSDLALDTKRLNTDRAKLNRAQRRLNTAQKAYDKTIAGGTEAQQAESLAKLQEARNEVSRLAPVVADLEETVGEGKRKQSFDKFSRQLKDINRQLGDENISEKARQKLLIKRDGVLARMEKAGYGTRSEYVPPEGEKATPQAEGEGEVTGEGAPDAQEEVLKKAEETANDALNESVKNSDISPEDQPTAFKIIEQAERDLVGDSEGIADGTSTEEQDIVRRAMEMAEYDEQEIRDSLKKDSFWNAVMMFGLQMAAGASEGGDRFSNMARAAVIGLNEFNKDMKEKEKSAYARYRDKKADAFAEAGLELKRISSENQSKTLTNQLIMQRAQLGKMNFDVENTIKRTKQADKTFDLKVRKEIDDAVTGVLDRDNRGRRTLFEDRYIEKNKLPKDTKVPDSKLEPFVRDYYENQYGGSSSPDIIKLD